MGVSGLVGEGLKRLMAADLLTVVQGLRSAEFGGTETLLVSVLSDMPRDTRHSLVHVLDGLPCLWTEVDATRRGVVRGLTGVRDEQTWRIGIRADVDWVDHNVRVSRTVASAIPSIYDSYATVTIPEDGPSRRASDSALLRLLAEQSNDEPWWLGYLDTGAHDVVFYDAPRVSLYAGWPYVLVQAGPSQAWSWRQDDPWRGRLPDLIYPADRSWLVSMLWDDDWRCMGGPAGLIRAVLAEPALDSRRVSLDDDATPLGHDTR